MRHSIAAAAALLIVSVAAAGLFAIQSRADEASKEANTRSAEIMVKAYPEFIDRVEGNELVWKDGSRMPIDDGKEKKDFETLLNTADIKDQFYAAYPFGHNGLPPAKDIDPGRARNQAFFNKMYGDCLHGTVKANLVNIDWLPAHGGQKLLVTKVNGVADKLKAVSAELDTLPEKFLKYLKPSSGTYNCRPIAGTSRTSAHGLGIAIDNNASASDYWHWNKAEPDGSYPYVNRVPWEIVDIFEKHGFIWGGKWYHYDTMHFEYRPEILAAGR